MMKVKGYSQLSKDPVSGAVILTPEYKKENIQLDLLQKKITAVYDQNKHIIELLERILNK